MTLIHHDVYYILLQRILLQDSLNALIHEGFLGKGYLDGSFGIQNISENKNDLFPFALDSCIQVPSPFLTISPIEKNYCCQTVEIFHLNYQDILFCNRI